MFYVEAGQQRDAIEMYNKASRWTDSYRLAAEFLGQEETEKLYLNLASKMEKSNQFENAAKIYESLGQVEKAIDMYKKGNKFDEIISLSKRYDPEHLKDTYKDIGNSLEENGDLKSAEEYYLKTGDWQSVVNMYRAAERWSDAYRVAKEEGTETVQKQIAYLWAKGLGGDAAVKLLQKLHLFEETIEYACQNKAYEFAFEMCRIGEQSKVPYVHMQCAIHMEEEGNYKEAEENYIASENPKEAILMYLHLQQWEQAEQIAQKHCEEMLQEIYLGRAGAAIQNQDYAEAESLLLRANRADVILQHYKQQDMWSEALRIARDYIPSSLHQIQEEYDEVQLRSGAKGALSYVAQGKNWEEQGNYQKALECYLKVNDTLTEDSQMIATVMVRAGEVITRFLPPREAKEIAKEVTERLIGCQRYAEAADLSLRTNCPENAVKAYILAADWTKAKKIAAEFAPDLEYTVSEKYKESLRSSGKLGELIDVDTVSAINMLIEKGQWEKALETAKQKSHRSLLDKYLAMYASLLISKKQFLDAVQTYERYGASCNPNNLNIYKVLFEQVYAEADSDTINSYSPWAYLRNMLLSACTDFANSPDSDGEAKELFERYLEVAHFKAVLCALSERSNSYLQVTRQQIYVSLLRYTDIINSERAFYEAGLICKKNEDEKAKLAFLFLNHFLDIFDAVEQQDAFSVDTTRFCGSDIPQEVPLPEQHLVSQEAYEDVKEWVLAASVEIGIDDENIPEQGGCLEGSLRSSSGVRLQPCIISGYPAGANAKTFGSSGKVANRQNWDHLVVEHKTRPSEQTEDVLLFIARWTQTPLSLAV